MINAVMGGAEILGKMWEKDEGEWSGVRWGRKEAEVLQFGVRIFGMCYFRFCIPNTD
jgi:hypothetical protein